MRKNTLIAVTAAALATVTLAGCTTTATTTTAPSATATTAPTGTTAVSPTTTAEDSRIPAVIDGAGSAALGTATLDISDSTLILTDAAGAQVGPTIPVKLAGEVEGPALGDIAWFSSGDAGIDAIGGHYWDAADVFHRVDILESTDAPTLPTDEVPETNTTLVAHADPAAWDGLGSVDRWIYGDIARGSLKLSIVD